MSLVLLVLPLVVLAVKVSNVANNGVVLPLHEMFASEDISTAGGGDEDVAPVNAILDGGHLKGFKMLKLVRAKKR